MSDDNEGLEHFALADENSQLIGIIDAISRSMGLESWADLENIVKKAKADCDRLRKLHKIMAQESCSAIPQHLETLDQFRIWIDDGMPDVE